MSDINITIKPGSSKEEVFKQVRTFLEDRELNITAYDISRPWGGFFVIEEYQAADFIKLFFPHLQPDDFKGFKKLSPKILMVAPEKRLSWQYHHRRSEIWKIIAGKAAVSISNNDEETPPKVLEPGSVVELEQGQRHRLIGTDQWGIAAEIWKHTNPEKPSDENDIVRIQDDFGR